MMHLCALLVCNASNLKSSVLHKGMLLSLLLVWLVGVPSYAGLHRGLIACLTVLMCALHAGQQDVHPPAPGALDLGNVWGFARMDVRFWALQQQPPKEAGNQQQHSPEQLQELLHKQRVCPMGPKSPLALVVVCHVEQGQMYGLLSCTPVRG